MAAQPPAQTMQSAMPMQSLLAAQSAIGRPLVDLNDRDACRIFVGSLPFECGDRELRALVDQVPFTPTTQGTSLQECRVLPGKGCGYIKFGSWEAAEQAMACLQDRMVDGWKVPLRLKWAVPKDKMPSNGPQSGLA